MNDHQTQHPDWLLERRSGVKKPLTSTKPHSNAPDEGAQRDRARIIHCAAFRRLQSKTQILGVGEHDFYRTRLTHTLEVAQIGSGICEKLRYDQRIEQSWRNHIASISQMEAICLAHDIGHPPFGHGGEGALNAFMHRYGGFEGNGQTLRIIAKLGEYHPHHGIDVTRRTMLGLLKYPVLYRHIKSDPSPNQTLTEDLSQGNLATKIHQPPKCIHDDEEEVLAWILSPFLVSDRQKFQSISDQQSQYKSFDTSIMELADDIAYGVHDLEDAVALNLVGEKQWQEETMTDKLVANHFFTQDNLAPDYFKQKLFSDSNNDRKFIISKLVFYFMENITIRAQGVFQNPLLDLQAVMSKDAETNLNNLKTFVLDRVIKTQEVKMHEYKGQQIIRQLFATLLDNTRLLPPSSYQKIDSSEQNPQRTICDYIAGMTDNYALKFYQKLF